MIVDNKKMEIFEIHIYLINLILLHKTINMHESFYKVCVKIIHKVLIISLRSSHHRKIASIKVKFLKSYLRKYENN